MKNSNDDIKEIHRILRTLSMDTCSVDILVEFFSVTFHNILYYAQVYPRSVFETRKKYSVIVYRSVHPEVNQYLDLCLKSIAEHLKSGQLSRIEFSVTDSVHKPVVKFVFDIGSFGSFDENFDAYLVRAEENIRAYCLHLSTICYKFKNLPENRSFTIHLHTNESNAVALANLPYLEDFPLIEVEDETEEMNHIQPVRRFSIRNYNLDTYIEFNGV